MRFEKIDLDSFFFDDVKSIYESSFPSDEKRELNKELFDKPNFSLIAVVEESVVGFISTWDFGDFVFIEHFAVKKELREHGFGTKMLSEFLAKNKSIVLEVEMPQSEEQYLRIKFYEKMGFKLNVYPYIQPPYGHGKKPVNMFIMTYPSVLTQPQFLSIKQKLYSEVYGVK